MSAGLLARLESLNPGLPFADCADASFAEYGRLLDLDAGGLADALALHAPIGEGTAYHRSCTPLEDLPFSAASAPRPGPAPRETWAEHLGRAVFGGAPAQIGWVAGHSSRLNALEYHKSSEVLVAGSDLVLLLGRLGDIEDYRRYDPSKLKAFLVRRGQAIETWSTTLHFAPVMVSPEGFRAAIVLPRGTNAPLAKIEPGAPGEEGLLWAENKWLIACPGSAPAGKGARPGVEGNPEVHF